MHRPSNGWRGAVAACAAALACIATGAPTLESAPRLVVQNGGQVQVVAIRSDGSMVATAGQRQVQLWATADGRLLCDLPTTEVGGLAFSRDGRKLVGSVRTSSPPGPRGFDSAQVALQVWDVPGCQALPTPASWRFDAQAVLRPLDGDRVLILQPRKLSIVQPFGEAAKPIDLAVSRQGEIVAAHAENGAALVQVDRSGRLQVLDLGDGRVEPLSGMEGADPADFARPSLPIAAISRSGRFVVAPGADREWLVLYDRQARRMLARVAVQQARATTSPAMPSGVWGANWLAISDDEKRLYGLVSRRRPAFGGNGIMTETVLQVRNLPDLALVRETTLSPGTMALQSIGLGALSADGSRLAFAARGAPTSGWGSIHLRTRDAQVDRWIAQTHLATGVAWGDGNALVLAGIGLDTAGNRIDGRPFSWPYLVRWPLTNGSPSVMTPPLSAGGAMALVGPSSSALSADGRRMAYSELVGQPGGFEIVTRVVGVPDFASVWEERSPTQVPLAPMLALDGIGSTLAVRDNAGAALRLFDLNTGQKIGELREPGGAATNLRFTPDADAVLFDSTRDTVRVALRGPDALKPVRQPFEPWRGTVPDLPDHLKENIGNTIARDASGRWLATAGPSPASPVEVHDLSSMTATRVELPDAARGSVALLSFSPDARTLAVVNREGTVTLWNIARKAWLVRLYSFVDGTWVAVDPQGRFDTNRLDSVRHLHWVMPDEPLRTWPLEIFMRQYYEPRLVARVLGGASLPAVRSIASINRLRPRTRIAEVTPAANGTVTVTVELESTRDERGRSSGVRDLRLFRDGSLVARALPDAGAPAAASGMTRVRFEAIRLPSRAEPVEFTAYAFNSDGVKSETARLQHRQAATPRSKPRKAYVVAIGVDAYQNAAWNLQFAANDAREISRTLAASVGATRRYDEVIPVELIAARSGDGQATRNQIKSVLDRLAGRAGDEATLRAVPGADRLAAATPDDLVVLSFSGHGYLDGSARFHLFPSDIGTGTNRQISSSLLARTVSSDDLADWLEGIDAGSFTLVIDACHSAAAVDSGGFKPGPMGSRGLGQLAYDKGIRILAASQADDVAIESGSLRHGLLTFALVNDGIAQGRADHAPKDRRIDVAEWLSYAVTRVPALHREVTEGKVVGADPGKRGATLRIDTTAAGARLTKQGVAQQPALFDFKEAGDDAVIVDLVGR